MIKFISGKSLVLNCIILFIGTKSNAKYILSSSLFKGTVWWNKEEGNMINLFDLNDINVIKFFTLISIFDMTFLL